MLILSIVTHDKKNLVGRTFIVNFKDLKLRKKKTSLQSEKKFSARAGKSYFSRKCTQLL